MLSNVATKNSKNHPVFKHNKVVSKNTILHRGFWNLNCESSLSYAAEAKIEKNVEVQKINIMQSAGGD